MVRFDAVKYFLLQSQRMIVATYNRGLGLDGPLCVKGMIALLLADAQDHDFGGFDEGGGGLARFELHLASGSCSDDRSDLLAANRNLYFRHQAADPDRIDPSHQLIPPADAADNLAAFLLGPASRAEEQAV
jgi:hypothetical protein